VEALTQRRVAPQNLKQTLFLCLLLNYGGCTRGVLGRAGFLSAGLPHPRTAATHHVEVMLADISLTQEVSQ